ncbi:MAG: DUF885 domain-containing protein, partial [Acidobacteria bacterium]
MPIIFFRDFICAVFLGLIVLMAGRPAFSQETPGSATTVESRTHVLASLLNEEWEYELRTSPEFATSIGDPRYNDRFSDESPEFHQSNVEQKRQFLGRFEAIDPSGFSEQDKLSRQLMVRQLQQDIEGARFKNWEMPVNQMSGPHLELPDLITLTPFNTVKDYQDYISRLRQIPHVLDQVTANMRQGMANHLMPARFLLEKVAPEVDDIAKQPGENSPFAKPLKQFPSGIPDADQKLLRDAILSAITDQVIPAYRKFGEFVR